jgi:hypothetical protein
MGCSEGKLLLPECLLSIFLNGKGEADVFPKIDATKKEG